MVYKTGQPQCYTERGIGYESVGPSFRMKTDGPCLWVFPVPQLYFILNFCNSVTFVCLKEK